MSKESENFDSLKKLLSLKGHEQPPPGFFRDLPGRVLSRIEFEETQRTGFWCRVRSAFELRPALSAACAGGLCLLLLTGIHLGKQAAGQGGADLAVNERSAEVQNPFNATTGGASQPPAGIFDPVNSIQVDRAKFETNAAPPRRP